MSVDYGHGEHVLPGLEICVVRRTFFSLYRRSSMPVENSHNRLQVRCSPRPLAAQVWRAHGRGLVKGLVGSTSVFVQIRVVNLAIHVY